MSPQLSRAAAGLGLAAALAVPVAGCSSSSEKAAEAASASATALAADTTNQLRRQTRDLSAPLTNASLARAVRTAMVVDADDNKIQQTAVTGAGGRADLMFVSRAQRGGGGTYADVSVRLCVRATITPGPAGNVTTTNRTCPPLAGTIWDGRVDQDVTLEQPIVADAD